MREEGGLCTDPLGNWLAQPAEPIIQPTQKRNCQAIEVSILEPIGVQAQVAVSQQFTKSGEVATIKAV